MTWVHMCVIVLSPGWQFSGCGTPLEYRENKHANTELSDKCLAVLDEGTTHICLICPLCYQNKCKLRTENKRQNAELKEGTYEE